MKNFTDFMVDAAQNPELGKEAMSKLNEADHTSLVTWLKEKGYDVDEADCKKLYDNKDPIEKGTSVGLTY